MKPNLKYTSWGHSVEVTPGGKTAWAGKPGGERREFTTIPDSLDEAGDVVCGITAQVQAQQWIQGKLDEAKWTALGAADRIAEAENILAAIEAIRFVAEAATEEPVEEPTEIEGDE